MTSKPAGSLVADRGTANAGTGSSIHGSFDDATQIAFDFDRSDATGGVSFVANDLGRLWRALALGVEIEGGTLPTDRRRDTGGEGIAAHGELRSFTVTEMPVFASILRLGTLDSLVGMFESKGLQFELAEADLALGRQTPCRWERGEPWRRDRMTGEGSFDLIGGLLDFSAPWPCQGLAPGGAHPADNTLVLGAIAPGSCATRFRLTGAVADPEIHVEPLSTLTPGLVRDGSAPPPALSPRPSQGP